MKFLKAVTVFSSLILSIPVMAKTDEASVVDHYAAIAHAVFSDSLITANKLQQKIHTLVKNPSVETLSDARKAWIAARVPYQQSEVFRFGNPVVDDWEGQLNAWPLDEGLIDYVATEDYHYEMGNVGATANIVANKAIKVGGKTLDVSSITPSLLGSLNELGGSEANVATGYHAIEFLLWGQDLNGTGAGAGNRDYTDFIAGKGCTNGNCDRRVAYLEAAVELLIDDLEEMEAQWRSGAENYRSELNALKPKLGLTRALFGMGSLALGELAGERIKVALEANSTEDEHDCFSDNTHYSHFYNAKGIENVYLGRYRRVDGSELTGPSIADLVAKSDLDLAKKTGAQFEITMKSLQTMVDKAEAGRNAMKFDQMIAEGNDKGAAILMDSITKLVALTRDIEKVAMSLGVDNLNPDTADHEF